MRVTNKILRNQDLTYLEVEIQNFRGNGSKIRDNSNCYKRDAGFTDSTMQDSGNVVVKIRTGDLSPLQRFLECHAVLLQSQSYFRGALLVTRIF